MKKRKLALHIRIILGLFFGVLFSFLLLYSPLGSSYVILQTGDSILEISKAELFVRNWIKPFGTIFINALKLIAIPLIFVSLISGISNLKDISSLSRMGLRTIALYLFTTVFAVSLGLVLTNVIKPGNSISTETRESLLISYGSDTDREMLKLSEQVDRAPLQALEDLVPDNIVSAASNNKNMLQVIVFAIFIGIAIVLIPKEKAKPAKDFFESFNEVILKLIDMIMQVAPYGVFALMAALVVEAPNAELFVALLWYAMTVILSLSIMLGFYLLLIYVFTKKTPRFYFRAMAPAQLLAFSTSSSAATLPVTMDRVKNHLGVDSEVANFVLPIGATINMDGTSLYQAVAAIFIAQSFGLDLTISVQLGIILTATLASIGTAAVPSAGMVMLLIVLAQAGIPEIGLALIFAIDRPLDMLRTVINISGDATVSILVDKSLEK